MDPLYIINSEKYAEVLELLVTELPRSFVVKNWIETRLRWKKKINHENSFFICCPGGNVEDGIITFGYVGEKFYSLSIYNFNEDLTNIEIALLNTKRIDWKNKLVCGVPQGLEKWLSNIVDRLGFKVDRDVQTNFYVLPKEIPSSFEMKCPKDVYVALLTQKDIPKINSLWSYRYDGSEKLLAECVSLNYGFGVFAKKDGRLLSWILKEEYSDLSVLHTLEDSRRNGYGKLVVQAICKQTAEDGEDALTFIVPGNVPSENLFKGLGFVQSGSYNWLEYEIKIAK